MVNRGNNETNVLSKPRDIWRISATIVLLQLELSRVLRVDEPGDVARRAVSTFRIISLHAFAVE